LLSPAQREAIDEGRAALLHGLSVPENITFEADDFQQEAIQSVKDGFDTLVVAPTGSGKTFIAFEALAEAIKLGKRGVYTTPLKALSNTKYNELRFRFKGVCEVGLLTGDRKIDSDSQIVVATTEIYRNELYREAPGDALVILDEVHFIADPQRGPVWEESIILTPNNSTLLMLSASISNATEIAEWISETRARDCKIVTKIDRPVELRYAFLHPELGILPLRNSKGEVFKEVANYYAGVGIDNTGMRLKGGRFSKNRSSSNKRPSGGINSRRPSGAKPPSSGKK
jgi:ATP-dependent RNA helicase HelY